MSIHIGIGYDVHRLAEGRPCVLGGVELDSDVGLVGHSDADVLAHALMDAVLGAMRAGDIGSHFPDTDPAYSGISSMELLERVAAMMRDEGFAFIDGDCVLSLERPRIAPYRDEMRARLAAALGVEAARIGVKATTTEGLGPMGRGEGVAAQAVIILEKA